MRRSTQDRYYLDVEGDRFFERNTAGVDPHTLRDKKRSIVEHIGAAGIRPRRVLEYGCQHGDLLDHYAREFGAECVGIEASAGAVAFGRSAYGDRVRLEHGTIADNPLQSGDDERLGFDLVVVDDVLCWVSRPTIFQSIANIDDALAEDGHLFLREFLPDSNSRNRNHHAGDTEIWCHKPAGPHYRMFTASGCYEVVWQRVWLDEDDAWARERGRPFESRWVDSVLCKSWSRWFR